MSSHPDPHSPISARLGRNLKRLRSEAGLTQTDVARGAGITRAHYAALETGTSSNGGPANPRLSTLVSLSRALGTELDEVLSGITAHTT